MEVTLKFNHYGEAMQAINGDRYWQVLDGFKTYLDTLKTPHVKTAEVVAKFNELCDLNGLSHT